MSRELSCCGEYTAEGRDDEHFAEFERGGGDASSQSGEVVLVAMLDFLDEAMFAQAADEPGNLSGGPVVEMVLKVGVAESGDGELAADDSAEDVEVIAMEKIEAAVGAVVGLYGAGNLVEVLDPVRSLYHNRDGETVRRDGPKTKLN